MQTERYIAAADLGSAKVSLCVAKVGGEETNVFYYKEEPSDGVQYSRVVHPRRLAVPLQKLVQDAEAELNVKIRQLVVGLPRYELRQVVATARVDRSDPESLITREEVNSLKASAVETYPMEDAVREEIYGAVAQSFSADEEFSGVSETDIVGVTADKIDGNFKLFIGARKPISNLDIMFNGMGMAVARKMFAPDAVASAVLTETERFNGVALVEVGAGVTSLSIYRGKVLRHFSSIPFGGRSITNDIALECGFDERLAENIKLAFGACMPTKLQSLSDKVLQINDDETGSYEQLTINHLSEIITARSKEIIEAILYNLQESGYADKIRSGIVLTGGGANLINFSLLLRDMSGYKVRIGFPRRQAFTAFGCQDVFETSASAAVGMVLEAKRDMRLNCAEDLGMENEPPAGPVPGELFPSTGGGVIAPPAGGGKKPVQGRGVTWLTRTKDKAEAAVKSLFDNTLGSLFDTMEDDRII